MAEVDTSRDYDSVARKGKISDLRARLSQLKDRLHKQTHITVENEFIEMPVDACMLTQEALAASAMADLSTEYKDRVEKTKEELLEATKEITFKPFMGFGLSVHEEENCLLVDNVFVGAPAHQVGVRPGHRLLRIAGTPVNDLDSFRSLVADHCKCGEFTHFSFRRPGESISSNISVWVMTSDGDAAGKHYHFDVSKGVRIANETDN